MRRRAPGDAAAAPAAAYPGKRRRPLAAEADRVAALTPGTCEARDAAVRFRNDVIASIGRIPTRWQEPLTSAANSLAARLATCVEPKPEPRKHKPHHGHHGKHGEQD